MVDKVLTLEAPLTGDEPPKETVIGLTQTGAEVKAPTAQPTDLDLGRYYTDQIPGSMTASWESNAEKQAGLKFQENVAKSQASMLRSRQEMEQQGQQMQTQLSLGEYMREQSAEKAGWTGGYMLDQARQGEYLKSTIQAQLYGQQELQKYGMESQLEAARLAYDLGKEQLALQYYNEAYQKALTEAQLFGYYVAPETRDMFNQYQAAITALKANPGDENAQRVKRTVEDFYKDENLTEADLRKYSTATFEMQQYMEGKLEATLALIDEDPSKFIVKDSNGNYALDANNRYVMLDFDEVDSKDLMAFLNTDNADGTSKTSDSAVKSYMRYLGQSTINGYFSSLEEGTVPTNEGFVAWLQDNPSLLNEWFKATIGEDDKADFFDQVGKEVTATLAGPDGSLTVTFNLDTNTIKVGNQQTQQGGNEEGETTPIPDQTFSERYSEIEYLFGGTKPSWDKVLDSYGDFASARFNDGTQWDNAKVLDIFNNDNKLYKQYTVDKKYEESDWAKLFELGVRRVESSGSTDYNKDIRSFYADVIKKKFGIAGEVTVGEMTAEKRDHQSWEEKLPTILIKPKNETEANALKEKGLYYSNKLGGYVLQYQYQAKNNNNYGFVKQGDGITVPGTPIVGFFWKSGSGYNDRYNQETKTLSFLAHYLLKMN